MKYATLQVEGKQEKLNVPSRALVQLQHLQPQRRSFNHKFDHFRPLLSDASKREVKISVGHQILYAQWNAILYNTSRSDLLRLPSWSTSMKRRLFELLTSYSGFSCTSHAVWRRYRLQRDFWMSFGWSHFKRECFLFVKILLTLRTARYGSCRNNISTSWQWLILFLQS